MFSYLIDLTRITFKGLRLKMSRPNRKPPAQLPKVNPPAKAAPVKPTGKSASTGLKGRKKPTLEEPQSP